MMANVGGVDRILRIVVGLVLISLVWLVPTNWGWVGVVPLLTGVFRFCPPYALFGWNTCSLDQRKA